jgi:hypothetical protein
MTKHYCLLIVRTNQNRLIALSPKQTVDHKRQIKNSQKAKKKNEIKIEMISIVGSLMEF